MATATEAIWSVQGVNVAWESAKPPTLPQQPSRSLFVCPACGLKVRVISGEGWPSCCAQPMFVIPCSVAP
jgi:hypothetical protein